MKETMREKYNQVKCLLARNGVAAGDAREILDTIQGICYRWAVASAAARVNDEALREHMPIEVYNAATSGESVVREMDERVRENYPSEWFDEGPEEPVEPEEGGLYD